MFSNSGEQAAVFHVYDKFDLEAIPRRYMVEAGKQLNDVWTTHLAKYDLWVLGPNGFHRSFSGDLSKKLQIETLAEIRVCVEACEPQLYLKVRNDAEKSAQLIIKANAYLPHESWQMDSSREEKQLSWEMSDFGGWYDFTVSIQGDPSYSRRFAGRVETQEDSISDPYMGYSDI